MDAGIDSLKVEGRMKTALYVATVARTYRKALDDLACSLEQYQQNMEWYKEEIGKCTTRKFTTGFFYGKPDSDTQIYDNNTYTQDYIYLGIVGDANGEGRFALEQRNKFSVGEEIEIMKPDGRNVSVTVEGIWAEDGTVQESAPHPKQALWVRLSEQPDKYDILRRRG